VAIRQIGERIRAERERRGVSLRSLARTVGLSPSLISQIETGKCRPSVSTLYAITTALGVSVEDVFGEQPAPADEKVGAGQAAQPVAGEAATVEAAGAPAVAEFARIRWADGLPVAPVVHPGEREVLELDSGVTWERLGHVPGSHVDFLRVTHAPGGTSSPAGRLMRHGGTEYGYLVEGELVVTLGFRSYRLRPGDSISFASSTPHSYRNEGTVPAVGIWFVTEADEGTSR
jgi:transcriptional regulator with XRE-family HTH domain/quercetin dioxygenase-like cupin family protein